MSRILAVEPLLAEPGPANRGRSFDTRYPDRQRDAPPPTEMTLQETIKFIGPARRFGFVVPDDDGREMFVHSSVMFRSGMTDLAPGQHVTVCAESAPRRLQATDIEPV